MEQQGTYQTESAHFALDGATGVRLSIRLTPFQPIEVYRMGWVAVEDIDDSATLLAQRGTIGGSYTTVATLVSGGAIAQGKGVFHNFSEPAIVIPGEEMVMNLTETAAASADVAGFFHFKPIGFAAVGAVQKGASSSFPPTGGYPAPSVDPRIIDDRLANMTEVAPT